MEGRWSSLLKPRSFKFLPYHRRTSIRWYDEISTIYTFFNQSQDRRPVECDVIEWKKCKWSCKLGAIYGRNLDGLVLSKCSVLSLSHAAAAAATAAATRPHRAACHRRACAETMSIGIGELWRRSSTTCALISFCVLFSMISFFFDLHKCAHTNYNVDKFMQRLDRTEGSSTMIFSLGVPESNFDT